MKKFTCYARAVALSILAAFAIDAALNFDEYKEGFLAARKKKQEEKSNFTISKLPAQVGKVSAVLATLIVGN